MPDSAMAETGMLHDASTDELRDSYDPERQLIKALVRLAKASTPLRLRETFETHLEETQGHVERLERVAHARLAGISAARIVNCWPMDRLLSWLSDSASERRGARTEDGSLHHA